MFLEFFHSSIQTPLSQQYDSPFSNAHAVLIVVSLSFANLKLFKLKCPPCGIC